MVDLYLNYTTIWASCVILVLYILFSSPWINKILPFVTLDYEFHCRLCPFHSEIGHLANLLTIHSQSQYYSQSEFNVLFVHFFSWLYISCLLILLCIIFHLACHYVNYIYCLEPIVYHPQFPLYFLFNKSLLYLLILCKSFFFFKSYFLPITISNSNLFNFWSNFSFFLISINVVLLFIIIMS